MQNLKSKKFSLVILAAVLSLNWYVGVQAVRHEQYDVSSSPVHLNANLPHIPSLDATQLPPSLASIHLNGFRDHLWSIQELPVFAFTFTPHTDPAKSLSQQSMQQDPSTIEEMPTSTATTNTRTLQPDNAAAEMKTSANTSTNLSTITPVTHKAQNRQSGDLLKVLALYFMMNRGMQR